MARPKFTLVAKPTFTAKVAIPIPGQAAEMVEFTFKGRTRDQFAEFIDSIKDGEAKDVDVIMVGEMRGRETISTAVTAAETGHLVFSTLHTNNAATCLPRLLDMGIEPFLIASTVKAVVGQRLVRRLCKVCKEEYQPEKTETDTIATVFGLNSSADMTHIHELEKKAQTQGIGSDIGEKLSSTGSSITRLYRPHPNGCDECNRSGYKGRMGIYEVLDNSNDIQKLIVANATSTDIQAQAVREGMMTMQVDGFIKALRGQTSIEEILRVTRE